jgi:tripartite-type tricarboxylate transporter receptor subunit TctC
VTLPDGVPEIVGAGGGVDDVEAGAVTAIENAGSEALAPVESLALMTIFENVPTFEEEGVPLSCPLALLNAAHAGLLATKKVKVRPLPSVAVGMKL